MLGGDWPVSNLCGGYAKSWNAYEEILSKVLSDKELELIQSKNAIQFYKLKP
jgi:predicted TIM-barrel fold metal-dependent hydrolase